ncbi:MAG: lysophospholipid acyltransferase family protein [bacterium]
MVTILNFFLSLYCWTVISVFTVILGMLAAIISFFSENISGKIAKLWGILILKACRIKVNITGSENIDRSKSYLIISNHQSYFDIFVLLACLDLNFKFIAKASLFKIPFLGWSMKRLGYIPIDRKNLKSALKTIHGVNSKLKTNKSWSVLIFPEGTRSSDGKLSSFKKGGLNKLIANSDNILPVAISGTYKVLKKGSIAIYPKNDIKLTVLKSITVNNDNGVIKTDDEFILNIQKNIAENI